MATSPRELVLQAWRGSSVGYSACLVGTLGTRQYMDTTNQGSGQERPPLMLPHLTSLPEKTQKKIRCRIASSTEVQFQEAAGRSSLFNPTGGMVEM